ncbi:HNH endonuclease signature motif containing protein [Burkholderia ubonensis]|uniref:HNH endonuclease n=1 Tax=Burkholderia ubonensis TaxID=101571 RepID=UPI0009B4A589|nr:HNH endonuclease signature motif containing protein [Burkholderia ubonensis]
MKNTHLSPVEHAIEYLRAMVISPALNSELPNEIKNKVNHVDRWLSNFKRVGDLAIYLARFDGYQSSSVYSAMKKCGLVTFEDISSEFNRQFTQWISDATRPSDFVVGETYSTYDILIFVRNYDLRSGGMFVLETDGKPNLVVIKATFNGGRYANEWLIRGRKLKYFLKSKGSVFGEHFKPNAAVMNIAGIPILTFVRDNNEQPFTYAGIFKYKQIHREADGSKWFELNHNKFHSLVETTDSEFAQDDLNVRIEQSLELSDDELEHRARKAPKKPARLSARTTIFDRDPNVIALVLRRAQGRCQECNEVAPFIRKKDGTPYLEVHHRVPLAQNGDDSIENAVALCPNCHRRMHFG